MSGRKKSPCRAMARTVALAALPIVWQSMLLMITQDMSGKATHWKRSARAPISTTSASSPRKTAMIPGAKMNPATASTVSTTTDTRTQNQKPSRTRL